jgi:ribose-phosphate pyrophosphokinase
LTEPKEKQGTPDQKEPGDQQGPAQDLFRHRPLKLYPFYAGAGAGGDIKIPNGSTQLEVLERGPNLDHRLSIFTGNAHPDFARRVCEVLGVELGGVDVFEFSNENIFVRYHSSIRAHDVFIIQSIASPVNRSLMELFIMLDAARRASADRITAVIPYYAYGRTDKKDQPRVPITARLIADFLQVAGANRVVTMDLHAGQIQGFFTIPVDELTAFFTLAEYVRTRRLLNPVVVAADIGIAKRARNFAEYLGVPTAIIEKRRSPSGTGVEVLTVIGDVAGRDAVIFDDEIDTAGTMVRAAEALLAAGVRSVYAVATHGVFSGPAIQRLSTGPFEEVVVTDTLPLPPEKRIPKITVLSVAPLFAEAIRRIHLGLSIGEMYEVLI